MTAGAITDVPGVRAGHWTGSTTGVTVILAPTGCTAAGALGGGAPATREWALVEQGTLVQHVDAVVFAGGSAFGLAAAEGVVEFLAGRGQGFPTRYGPVPIVVGAAVFDAGAAGDPPGRAEGLAAAETAERGEPAASGPVGGGTGATVGKWRGADHAVAGGLGQASSSDGDVVVAALAVVNAVGDVMADDGTPLAASTAPAGAPAYPGLGPMESTTLVAVATNAALSKPDCRLVAESAHDGLARALRPAHTRFDGDVAVALATGAVAASVDRVRASATEVVARAVREAVRR